MRRIDISENDRTTYIEKTGGPEVRLSRAHYGQPEAKLDIHDISDIGVAFDDQGGQIHTLHGERFSVDIPLNQLHALLTTDWYGA